MDIISHILIGKIIAFNQSWPIQMWSMFFSVLPDASQIPFYIFLGIKNKRIFWFPKNSDWSGARESHPFFALLSDVFHSLFFAAFVILPIVILTGLPKIIFFTYALHIIIDIFTHKKEWAIKFLWPIKYNIAGFAEAWMWPVKYMALSWAILLTITLILQ